MVMKSYFKNVKLNINPMIELIEYDKERIFKLLKRKSIKIIMPHNYNGLALESYFYMGMVSNKNLKYTDGNIYGDIIINGKFNLKQFKIELCPVMRNVINLGDNKFKGDISKIEIAKFILI